MSEITEENLDHWERNIHWFTDRKIMAALLAEVRRQRNATNDHVENLLAKIEEQAKEIERLRERNQRTAKRSAKFWCRAARAAFNGDDGELRNRVALAEAEPVELVLSEAVP